MEPFNIEGGFSTCVANRGGGTGPANPAAAKLIIISKSQEQWFFN